MNRQGKARTGGRGIEWTDYTWNPVGGCPFACRWTMPDGSEVRCYPEDIAAVVAAPHYPHGYAAHYFHPERLEEPLRLRTPSLIFLDSMADLLNPNVPHAHVEAVLDVVRQAPWHEFQLLTKNAPRLLRHRLPANCWAGVSAPPDVMRSNRLTAAQKEKMLRRQLDVLAHLDVPVVWMSIEPLAWDLAPLLDGSPLRWAVLGAGTRGRKAFQPNATYVRTVLDVLDRNRVPVFFKGNLKWSPWREEFPAIDVPALARRQSVIAPGVRGTGVAGRNGGGPSAP